MSLTPEEKNQQVVILEAIVGMEYTDGWKHFTIAAEELIKAHFPHGDHFDGVDGAIATASRVTFISGVKRCLGIVEQAKDKLKALTELNDDASAE